jgi:predicted DNA-binding transcriptional regulator AlpA
MDAAEPSPGGTACGWSEDERAERQHPARPRRGADPVDFLAVFNDPSLCATLPLSAVPPLLMQLAARLTRLTALQNALAARVLSAPAGPVACPRGPEHLLDGEEAAARLGMSTDWLYRHSRQFPFTRRVGRRALKFDSAGLDRWVAAQRRG